MRYRRVQLACGDRVLSEADNWYLVGRLTLDMNTALERTETPFGVAVRALDGAGVAMVDLRIERPTLDDVFLTLTGHAAEEAAATEEEI